MIARCILLCISSLTSVASFGLEPGDRVENFRLLDTHGKSHELFYYADVEAIVLIAGGHETIPPGSLETANRLQKHFAERVRFFGITTETRAATETNEHGYQFPLLLDLSRLATSSLEMKQYGEVQVITTADWRLKYRGMIDKGRSLENVATEHHLEDALTSILSKTRIARQKTPVNGELLPLPMMTNDVSYSTDVAPILLNKCVPCHRAGGIGPWAMTSYDQILGFSPMILEVMRTARMPPWHADPHIGHFANDRSLSHDETQVLFGWLQAGSPRGEGGDPLQDITERQTEWQLGEPDLIIDIPSFEIPATGIIDYRYVRIKNPLSRDVWLRASEIMPGDPMALHHVLTRFNSRVSPIPLTGTGIANLFNKWPLMHLRNLIYRFFQPAGSGFAQYIPGTGPAIPPEGTGVLLPAGARFTLQMHYTSYGRATTDRSRVGLYFHSTPPQHVLLEALMINPSLRIPPGAREHREQVGFTFKQDALLYSMLPHAHYRGKAAEFLAHFPDGREEVLLSVPHYQFNWQTKYQLAEPRFMPRGTRITFTMVWDNSEFNPENPDASVRATWGRQSFQEMHYGELTYRLLADGDQPAKFKDRKLPPVSADRDHQHPAQ